MSSSLLNVITYYQRSIEKNGHDEKRLLHCIEKLYKLPVKLEHLQSTGVGKTVNSLRKYDKEVGVAAKALVAKWKAMVAAEVPHEVEDDDLQRESHDDDDEDDDQSENSQNRDNTQVSTQNGRVAEERSSNSTTTHHSKHGEHHLSSSSSKDKHRNGHETDRQNSRSSRSHTSSHSSSSSKHRYDDRKAEKRGHSSGRREEKDLHKHAENARDIKKEPEDSDSDENGRTDRKLSIVEEIEQDFDVDDDDDDDDDEDDDEEKLIIDVSKEKTDEVEKRSKSESQELSSKYRHHSSKDSSRHESKREKERSKKEISSKERSPKTSSSRSKERSSKESSHSSREHSKKEGSNKESSSRSERNYSKDRSRREDHHTKESSRSRKETSPSREKDKEKESNFEKRERKEDRTYSDSSHKSKHSEKEKDSKKDHKERESSSSHKHRHRDKDKEREREKESTKSAPKNEESSKRKNSDSESKSDESSPVKAKVPKLLVDGIDSSMGTSFEEALGMISVSKGSKNSSSKKSPKAGTSSSSSGSSSGIFAKPSSRSPIESKTPPLLIPTAKLEPLDPSIALELPTISPNYKPMPLNPTVMECVFSQNKPRKGLLSDEEALHQGISSKTIRTKVYSGVRTGVLQQVPSLFDLCIRVLQKNIDALEYTGGVPFEVLKQVLDRATPQQLLIFEEYNPYLMEDSDALWKQHCMRHYRGQKRQEMETWREMFLRCKDEQDRKLSMLAENIKQSQKIIQQPIRKTQLAYVDSTVKPPRSVMKKQEQYGTKSNLIATPAARVASLANLTPNVSKIGDVRLRASARAPDTVQIAVAASNGRPKKAPLMQKTINFMKGRFKR